MPVYRFIPNIPVEVGRGVLCYAPGTLAAEGPEDEVLKLFGRAGTVMPLDEAADRAGDGDHELRPGLPGAGGGGDGRRAGARHGIEPARPRAW